jgi:hypothetical protein
VLIKLLCLFAEELLFLNNYALNKPTHQSSIFLEVLDIPELDGEADFAVDGSVSTCARTGRRDSDNDNDRTGRRDIDNDNDRTGRRDIDNDNDSLSLSRVRHKQSSVSTCARTGRRDSDNDNDRTGRRDIDNDNDSLSLSRVRHKQSSKEC